MGTDKWVLLSRLRTAVKKVKVLINFNVHRWRVATMIRRRSMATQRRFSFNDRPGLIAACEYEVQDDEEQEEEEEENKSGGGACSSEQEFYSPAGSFNSRSSGSVRLQRTTSYPENSPAGRENDDVDQRAEMFINNFRRQLQMERQVSLQIRYSNRVNSFNWRSP